MSASITLEPAYPGKTLNPVAYEVTTTLTDAGARIRCFIYVEDSPYSNTWTPITPPIDQPCVAQKATIYVGQFLKEQLDYDAPDPSGDQVVVAEKVCRRFKIEFYEYLTTDRELIAEYYQTTGSAAYYDIDELTNGQDYLIVMDKDSSEVKIKAVSTEIAATVPSNYLIATTDGHVGNEYHREIAPNATAFDEIQVPSGVKIKVYKWQKRTHVQPANTPAGLLGGISKELLYKPVAAPDAPSALTATPASSSRIDLSWTDNSDSETGFAIEGSSDGTNWTVLGTVATNITTYAETGLTEGTTRYYRVKATNGGKSSGWSNTSNATTFIPFIFTVNTANSGVSSSTQFTLPLLSSGTYNFNVLDWGDGSSDTITSYNQAETTHTYSTSGSYTVEIEGQILGWAFNNGGDCLKLTEISKWGNWQSNGIVNQLPQSGCFRGCANLDITATDSPDFSQATSMWACFSGCTSLSSNSSYNNWDVSTIQEFRTCFINSNFNNDLNNWDVSNGTTFIQMFSGISTYNSSTAGWDINGPIEGMFLNCPAFTGIGLNTWDVAGATGNFNDIFEGTQMNADISGWDPSGITGGWRHFVKDNTDFNQDISTWANIECAGQGAFQGATAFNSSLPNWTVKNNCSSMFSGATAFTGLGLSTWTIATVNSFANFLDNTAVTASTMDAILNAWAALGTIPSGITFGALNCTRTSASDTAVSTLETSYTWTFVGLTKV